MADRKAQQKVFVPLENNPIVMSNLAHKLGLSSDLSFHDVYSLTDPDLLAIVPRPAQALLFTYPRQVLDIHTLLFTAILISDV